VVPELDPVSGSLMLTGLVVPLSSLPPVDVDPPDSLPVSLSVPGDVVVSVAPVSAVVGSLVGAVVSQLASAAHVVLPLVLVPTVASVAVSPLVGEDPCVVVAPVDPVAPSVLPADAVAPPSSPQPTTSVATNPHTLEPPNHRIRPPYRIPPR
jgi:hypothetical protein